MTYNQLIQRFEWYCDGHPMIQSFTHGEFELSEDQKQKGYPAVHVQPLGVRYDVQKRTYRFEVYVMELHRENQNEANEVREDLSDCLQIFEDILAELKNGFDAFDREDFFPVFPVSPTPFIQEFNGVLNGVQGTIEIETSFFADACDSPVNTSSPPSQLCPDATVTINGVEYGTVGSGETLAALVQYVNGTPVGSLVSGIWTIPNPSGGSFDFTVNGDDFETISDDYDLNLVSSNGTALGNVAQYTLVPDFDAIVINDSAVNIVGGNTINQALRSDQVLAATIGVLIQDEDAQEIGAVVQGSPVSYTVTVPDAIRFVCDGGETTVAFTVIIRGGSLEVGSQTLTDGSIDSSGISINGGAGVSTFVGVTLNDGDEVEITYTPTGDPFLIDLE